ncbi:MAG: helix-turn-helix transcriptional regulator [Romboutsia sp.]|nr:helix-turn-helix transcriptional regulator [Romboutsia sp.]
MRLGDKIKQLRIASGYSQTELSKILKISQNCLSQYENSKREVTYYMLEDIMNAVGYNVNFERKILNEEDIESEINEVVNELKLGYEEHKNNLETLVVILDSKGIIVLNNKCAEKYLEIVKDSEFICPLTKKDFEKGFEYIEEYIKSSCFKKINSKLYQIKNYLYYELSSWTDMNFTLDIINDYVYINNIKLCRFDFIDSLESESDAIILRLIDGSDIYIVMHWPEDKDPYLFQIYREKLDEYDEEEWSCMLYNVLNS